MASEIWLKHIEAGEAYAAENFVIPGGGLIGHLQLFNPVGSGKRIRLRSLNMTAAAAHNGNVYRHDVPLATLGLPAPFIVENMLAGGPAEVAEHRSVVLAAAVGSIFWAMSAIANAPATYPPEGREWGFDLLEGQGIHATGALGAANIVMWHWVEVPL